jgi:hypothetical protein
MSQLELVYIHLLYLIYRYKNAASVQCLKASVIVFDKIEIIVVLPTHHARVHTSESAIEAPPQEKTPDHYAEEKMMGLEL